MLQLQPVPLAAVGVRPAGNVSVTVTVAPVVGPLPLFLTVNVNVAVPPRVSVAALDVLVMSSDGAVTVDVALAQLIAVHAAPGVAGDDPPAASTDA